MAEVAKVLGADWYLALMTVVLFFEVALLDRRPRHHRESHRKLRALAVRRGPAAGLHARCTAPAAGAQLSREFWHQEWLAEHQRFTHRGSAVPSSVETPPAVGTETVPAAGQPRDAFLPPLASRRGSVDPAIDVEPQPVAGGTHMTPATGLNDRNNTRWTEQWAAKKRAKRIARYRTGGNTPASTVTRSETRSSKTTTDPRTPVRSGSAVPRSCGPHPVVGAGMAPATGLSDRCSSRRGAVRSDPATGARTPVAGPKQPVDAAIPPTGVDRHPTPRPGENHEGHEGAVVREATAPARSAA